MKQSPDYWIARSIDDLALNWQIYRNGEWMDVTIDGVRPPSNVREHVLEGDNWYIFAGWVDSVGIIAGRLPMLTIEAWNIVPPVRRKLVDFLPPDTSGLPWLTVDDFATLLDFQRFTVNSAAQFWPPISTLERPRRPRDRRHAPL